MRDPAADGLLYLLKAEPTLLPEAPQKFTVQDMDRRCLDEVHSCLRCGQRAQCAFVGDTVIGLRWLDLCAACSRWLRINTSHD